MIAARRVSVGGGAGGAALAEGSECDKGAVCDSDSEGTEQVATRGWRKQANLRMYTILDKIF